MYTRATKEGENKEMKFTICRFKLNSIIIDWTIKNKKALYFKKSSLENNIPKNKNKCRRVEKSIVILLFTLERLSIYYLI